MSTHCILCGVLIYTISQQKKTWLMEYRAVRKRPDEEERPFVTGVGALENHDHRAVAPSDYNKRYDDEEFTPTPDDEFWCLTAQFRLPNPGFVFHEVCWQLLQELFYPQQVPVERFYDLCFSFPVHHGRWLGWGHAYGSLVKTSPPNHYAWETARINGLATRVLGMASSSPLTYYVADPLNVPELDMAIAEASNEETSDNPGISPSFRKHGDCFSILPVELCEEILIALPTKDVCNLRLTSGPFASITLSQSFWRSRFLPGFERDHIFEAKRSSSQPIDGINHLDWRILYDKTAPKKHPSKSLANRRRIWDICRQLVQELCRKPLRVIEPDITKLTFRGVGGDTIPDVPHYRNAGSPCKVLYEGAVELPPKITEILVSTVSFYDRNYVTGLQIATPDRPNVVLGYISPGQQTVLSLSKDTGKAGVLTGFVAAVGPGGIQALKATLLDGNESDWAGQPDRIPKTLRLCTNQRLTHLKGGFDGFRMVYLAVSNQAIAASGDENFPARAPPQLPLRTTAIWYPDVPPETDHLHESFFEGGQLPQNEYRPLIRVMFGGPNGSYLPYLTKITVTVSRSVIGGVDFEYEAEGAPLKIMHSCHNTRTMDDTVKIPFPIDGPGGERLTGLQAMGSFWSASEFSGGCQGEVNKLEVTTNCQRSVIFEPSAIPRVKMPTGGLPKPTKVKKLEVDSKTTITGIYVTHDAFVGMISLGVISEDLREEEWWEHTNSWTEL